MIYVLCYETLKVTKDSFVPDGFNGFDIRQNDPPAALYKKHKLKYILN